MCPARISGTIKIAFSAHTVAVINPTEWLINTVLTTGISYNRGSIAGS